MAPGKRLKLQKLIPTAKLGFALVHCAIAILTSSPSIAGDGKTKPLSEVTYQVSGTLYQSDFSKDDLDQKPWALQHGAWEIKNGTLAGNTNAEDNHEASLSLMLEVPLELHVSLDFTLGKGETFAVCFIGHSGPHGRIMIHENEAYIWMKAGDSGDARVIDYLPVELKPGETYHLSFLRSGDQLVATIGDHYQLAGRHPKFTHPKKRINFTTDSAKTRFDNLKVETITDVEAAPELFTRPSYTLSEFWDMREAKHGLLREVPDKKKQ
ncbi:MAG: hypothetical protein AAGH89_11730 [Verrucomicrobiota bacterium]